MISPLLRALIVIVLCISSLLLFIYLRSVHASKVKRSYALLFLLSMYYPFLDLSFAPLGIRVTPFDFTLWSFLVINIDFIKEFKHYKLLIWVLGMMVFTSLLSEFPIESVLSIPQSYRVYVLFVIAMVHFKSYNDLQDILSSVLKFIKWPLICAVLFGLIQIFLDSNFSLFYSQWNKEARISSCFFDPQIAGCSIGIMAILHLNVYLNTKYSNSFFLFAILVFIGLYTGSKVFLVGVALGILLALFFAKNRTKIIVSVLLISVVCILGLGVFNDLLIFERFDNLESSLEGRQEMYWLSAIDIFRDNWFSGIGTGVFQQYVEKHSYPLYHYIDGDIVYASQPESGYLLWLDEYGLFSIVLLIILYNLLKTSNRKFDYRIVLVPFLVAFVSLYNLGSSQLVYLLVVICGGLMSSGQMPVLNVKRMHTSDLKSLLQ